VLCVLFAKVYAIYYLPFSLAASQCCEIDSSDILVHYSVVVVVVVCVVLPAQ